MKSSAVTAISSASELWDPGSRRLFLKQLAVGGAIVLLPSALTSCDRRRGALEPGTGDPVTIDFARGDVAVLQFAFALEQLEADFYTRVVSSFGQSNLSSAEQQVLADLRNHEVIHREFLRIALGASGNFTLSTVYPGVNFGDRTSVLATARTFEDLGVAAYNGAAQYLSDVNNLLVAGKIVSVEARHASAIRDLINPRSGEFAPTPFDDAFRPSKVAAAAQGFIVDQLTFANAPGTFVQGPNNNG